MNYDDVRELIAKDKLKEAIDLLKSKVTTPDLFNSVIIQSAKYYEIKDLIRNDVISFENANISKSKIRKFLLELIDEFEEVEGDKYQLSQPKNSSGTWFKQKGNRQIIGMFTTAFIGVLCFLIFYSDFFQEGKYPKEIPVIKFENGKIIGNLPYQQHFYIEGSTRQRNNIIADEVEIKIYNIQNIYDENEIPSLDETEINEIVNAPSQNLFDFSRWNAYENKTNVNPFPEKFKSYFKKTLKKDYLYLLKISYYKTFNFRLVETEKEYLLEKLRNEAKKQYDIRGEIINTHIQKEYNEMIIEILTSKMLKSENNTFMIDKIKETIIPSKTNSLEKWIELMMQMLHLEISIKDQIYELEGLKNLMDAPDLSKEKERSLKMMKRKFTDELFKAKRQKKYIEESLSIEEGILNSQLVFITERYTISHHLNVTSTGL